MTDLRREESVDVNVLKENINYLNNEVKELTNKCNNLMETIQNKDHLIEFLDRSRKATTVKIKEYENLVNKLKNDNQYTVQKLSILNKELSDTKAANLELEMKLTAKEKSLNNNKNDRSFINTHRDVLNLSKSSCNSLNNINNYSLSRRNPKKSIEQINFKSPLHMIKNSKLTLNTSDLECKTPIELVTRRSELKEKFNNMTPRYILYSNREETNLTSNGKQIIDSQRSTNSLNFQVGETEIRGNLLKNIVNSLNEEKLQEINTLETLLWEGENINDKEKTERETKRILSCRTNQEVDELQPDFRSRFKENFNKFFKGSHVNNINNVNIISDRVQLKLALFFEKSDNKMLFFKFLLDCLKKKKHFSQILEKIHEKDIFYLVINKEYCDYLNIIENYLKRKVSIINFHSDRNEENLKSMRVKSMITKFSTKILNRRLNFFRKKVIYLKKSIYKLKIDKKQKKSASLVNYNKYKYQIKEIEEEGDNKEIDFNNITLSFKDKLSDFSIVMNNLSKEDIFLDKVKKNLTLDNVDQSDNFNINILESSFLKDKFKSFKSVKLQKEVASSFIIKCTKNRLLTSLRNLYYKELEITFTIQRKRKILIRNLTKESTDFSICSPLKKSASNLLIRDDLPSTNKETLIPISSRIYGTIATDYTTNATSMQNEGQTVNKSKEKLKAFYKKYLKYSDFLLKDTLKDVSRKPQKEEKTSKQFSQYKMYFTRNNILFNSKGSY